MAQAESINESAVISAMLRQLLPARRSCIVIE